MFKKQITTSAEMKECPYCNGSGKGSLYDFEEYYINGIYKEVDIDTRCPYCNGLGYYYDYLNVW